VHWLPHVTGIDNLAGRWYGFWSGFGGILERLIELAVIALILLRRHNCHAQGCLRIGRAPVEGTPWHVCWRHHPEGKPDHAHILAMHRRHKDDREGA
jgi:hypothetical protein